MTLAPLVTVNGGIPWTLQRTVAPSAILTTQECKDHLRETLSDANNDALIDAYARAAEDAVEKDLSRALLTQTWVLKLDRFPAWLIRLPRPPLSNVTSISYVEPINGTLTTLAADQYVVDTSCEPGRILKAYNVTWPSVRAIDNAVTITYVAGAANAAAVPSLLKTALKLMVADMYEHRERTLTGTIQSDLPIYERLVASYRLPTEFRYS